MSLEQYAIDMWEDNEDGTRRKVKAVPLNIAQSVLDGAREKAFFRGYEAGQAVSSGKMKGITWAEAKAQLQTKDSNNNNTEEGK